MKASLFKIIQTLFILLITIEISYSQTCNFPLPPSNTCANAPLLCDLDGYCSDNTAAVNSGTPNAFCGQVENNNWVSFIAGSPSFVLQITVSNCNAGTGLQAQIFATSDCQNFTAVSNCIDPVTTSSTLTANNLNIGQTYYLMIDGKNGDVCHYEIELLSGISLSPAHVEIQPLATLCEGAIIQLNAVATSTNNNLSYQWTTLSGNILSGSETSSISIDLGATYNVLVTDAGGCTDSTELEIPIFPNPEVAILVPDILDCLLNTTVELQGLTDTPDAIFDWMTTNGTILTGEMTAMPIVNQAGIYQLTVTNSTTNCHSSANVDVFTDIDSPNATTSGGGELNCLNETIILDGTGSSSGNQFFYQWTSTTGNILGDPTALFITVDQPGQYQLEVTSNANGCVSSTDVLVTLNEEKPTGAAIRALNPCFGTTEGGIVVDTVQGGIPPYLYAFDGIHFQTLPAIDFLEADTYSIVIQDATGCEWDTLITLQEQEELFVLLGNDTEIHLGDELKLRALVNRTLNLIDTLIWIPDYVCSNCFEQVIIPLETSYYQVEVIDINGCTAKDTIHIFVDKKRNIFIPNAFSPNNDGVNDLFYIHGGHDVEEIISFQIYNRWGGLVKSFDHFQANDPSKSWDGWLNGQKLGAGVFVYMADIRFVDGVLVRFSGDFVLIR